jgi:predicted transcriptional regulator
MPSAAKQLLREAVERLPDDASVEDAMDRLYFLAKVARGMEAADRGDLVSHAEARRLALGDDASDDAPAR